MEIWDSKNKRKLFIEEKSKFENIRYKINFLRIDIGTEYPYTIGVVICNKKTKKYGVISIKPPIDEYGEGSFPEKIDLICETKGILKLKIEFEVGSRMTWYNESFTIIVPKYIISLSENELKELLSEIVETY